MFGDEPFGRILQDSHDFKFLLDNDLRKKKARALKKTLDTPPQARQHFPLVKDAVLLIS
jgi:hypothetical protein